MAENDVVSTLNTLIQTCHDGEMGFRSAADDVRDTNVKSLFTEIARERHQFAEELKGEVRRLGGQPEESGSIVGAAHRGWMQAKGALTDQDDASIVSEAERGEDVAVATYRRALETSLPGDIHQTVQRQYSQVKDAHDRVRSLERAEDRGR